MACLKNTVAFLLSFIVIVTCFLGCNNYDNQASEPDISGTTNATKDYDISVYSFKKENAEQFKEMCVEYTFETGVKIKFSSVESNQDAMETLLAEMDSLNQPTIFTVQGIRELSEWEQRGLVLDFNKASEDKFKTMSEEIPSDFKLSSDGSNNYGIPIGVEGYGYLVDTQMISDLFETKSVNNLLQDIKIASYDEFKLLVNALDHYIKDNTVSTIKLNGKQYTLAPTKTELSKQLTGVFSVAGSEKWTYGDHMINVALATVFSTPVDAYKATNTQLDSLSNPLIKYAQALDLKTSHASGDTAPIQRGPEFVNPLVNGYEQAINHFASGKSVFLKQGSWVYRTIEQKNTEVAKRLTILPIKMPITQNDIKVPDMTVEKFNSSVPVYIPMYYAINAKATEKEQKLAQDFLVWLNTSEEGQKYITDAFQIIPYNITESKTFESPLNNVILEYKKAGHFLSDPYHGTPLSWSQNAVGQKIQNEYLTKQTWTKEDYKAISEYAVSEWKALKNQ